MKTLKQHIKEHMYNGGQVGAATSNAVEDGAIQQIDKLIVLAKGGKEEKKPMPPEKEQALNIATS